MLYSKRVPNQGGLGKTKWSFCEGFRQGAFSKRDDVKHSHLIFSELLKIFRDFDGSDITKQKRKHYYKYTFEKKSEKFSRNVMTCRKNCRTSVEKFKTGHPLLFANGRLRWLRRSPPAPRADPAPRRRGLGDAHLRRHHQLAEHAAATARRDARLNLAGSPPV